MKIIDTRTRDRISGDTTSPQHPQYHDPCRECKAEIEEQEATIVGLESKLGDRERQFNELDGILESTRRLFLSSNEYAEELIERISDLEHKLSMCKGCRTTDSILIAGLKKTLDEASKQIEELYEIIHDFRVGYGASRRFMVAVLIRNLNGDIAELKKERDAYKESIELERTDRVLLVGMLKIVNPLIKSGEYSRPNASGGLALEIGIEKMEIVRNMATVLMSAENKDDFLHILKAMQRELKERESDEGAHYRKALNEYVSGL